MNEVILLINDLIKRLPFWLCTLLQGWAHFYRDGHTFTGMGMAWLRGTCLPNTFVTEQVKVWFRLSGFQTLDVPDLCAIQIHYV